ncbi:MAG: SEC-C metal-binding domain-containing protein [Candidatus Nanopelagicales bacterium]
MFHVQPNGGEESEEQDGEEEPRISLGEDRPQQVQYSSPTLDEEVPAHVERGTLGGQPVARDPKYAGVSRNAPCPCGSGKKFKRCHGDPRNAA